MVSLDIFYLELWWPFCSAEQNCLGKFGRHHNEEHFCEIILNLDKWFKDILYLELWSLFSCVEWNRFGNFGRWHYEEHFCVIIFEFGPVVQESLFKDFLFRALVAILFSGAEPFRKFH